MHPESADRTRRLLGIDALEAIIRSNILIVGLGGVGSYAAEALARAGVGRFTLVDCGAVSRTNINRQIIALESTVGKAKTSVMLDRIHDINPDASVSVFNIKYSAETAGLIALDTFDFIVDAIDTVSCKIELILRAKAANIPIISAMGAGNKTNPSLFQITDLFSTDVCHFARVMRKRLRKCGIGSLTVVYSPEIPVKSFGEDSEPASRHKTPGTISFMPASAGLLMASHVINTIAANATKNIPAAEIAGGC